MSLPEAHNLPVFYDPAGRRGRRLRRVWIAAAAILSLKLRKEGK